MIGLEADTDEGDAIRPRRQRLGSQPPVAATVTANRARSADRPVADPHLAAPWSILRRCRGSQNKRRRKCNQSIHMPHILPQPTHTAHPIKLGGYLFSGALRVRTVTDCTVCGAISTVSAEAAGFMPS